VGGVDIENRRIFSALINENMIGKHIPSILSYSMEFSRMKVRNQKEFELLKKLKAKDEVKDAQSKIQTNHLFKSNQFAYLWLTCMIF
jgi:NifU-like protein involved in Fe-S cluster formation